MKFVIEPDYSVFGDIHAIENEYRLFKARVVAISTKSHLQNPAEYKRLLWKIRYTVDHLNLKAIVVYDVCGSDDKVMECFAYAVSKGIKIIIPNNTLKERNAARTKAVMYSG